METPSVPSKIDLHRFLYDRATLFSANEASRLSLVQRTLSAAVAGIDLNPDLSVEEGLFEIMQGIVETDATHQLRGLPAVTD